MKAISFFAGVGGFDLGFQQAGIATVGACELDPAARRIYAARFAPAWFPPDILEVAPDDIPPASVWCAGFPCQDLSTANARRDGFSGARSGLVWTLLDLAAHARPRWIVLENVSGMFSVDGGRGFGELVARLDDLGYVGAWRVLDAQFFGVAQRRRRVFLVACRAGVGSPAAVLSLGESGGGHPPPIRKARGDVAGTLAGSTNAGSGGHRFPGSTVAGAGAGHLVFPDPAYCLADATGHRTGTRVNSHDTFVGSPSGVRRLTPTECERLQGFPDGWTCVCEGDPCRCPDGPRYRALGNAVAVPVAAWVGRRLLSQASLS